MTRPVRTPHARCTGRVGARRSAALWVLAAALSACHAGSESAENAGAPGPGAAAGAAPHGVVLGADARERAQLEVETLAAAQLERELRAYGEVLDPAPLAELSFALSAADAARSASARELERARGLFRQDENTSARELEAAEAALERDRSAAETLRARLVGSYGAGLARRADLAALVQSLVAGQTALARLDLPLGEGADAEPLSARVSPLEGDAAPREANLMGPLPSANPALPGRSFLCLVGAPAPPAGMPLEGWLAVAGPPRAGVVVPRAALVRHAGAVYVYVERSAGEFERRAVEPLRAQGDGWFLGSGLAAGERVVSAGAQQLLSLELLAAGGEEE